MLSATEILCGISWITGPLPHRLLSTEICFRSRYNLTFAKLQVSFVTRVLAHHIATMLTTEANPKPFLLFTDTIK